MWRNRSPSSRRAEIQQIYQSYALEPNPLPASALLRFLHMEQQELSADEEKVKVLIDRYEIDKTAKENGSMTFEGFFRYMESKDCCVFDQTHRVVYQDMDQPLSSYFISSSHNTYLTGDQLIGESDLEAYIRALRKGCRCLEIDCWDGPDLEPVVYHGHTLTTKILFRDVIRIVEKHAFEDLKYKILIKNKKLKAQTSDPSGPEESADEGEEDEDEKEFEKQEEERDDTDQQARAKLWFTGKSGSKMNNKNKVVVAQALSDLVIYTKSVKFRSFTHSSEHQNYYENTSMPEKKARKLAKASGPEFVHHNQQFLSRIYPAGSRTSSSNYNPQEFWNVGAQLVALNFQSPGLAMDLNDGLFQDNGGCGYVLKPGELMSSQIIFDHRSRKYGLKPMNLLLKVISASNLPLPSHSKELNPFVRVEIHGISSDSCKKCTHAVKNNSLTPSWNADMNFTIKVPKLCLIRFYVQHQTGLFKSEFVGQYTLRFNCLKKGYRWVPLRSREGCNLDPASLFIFVWYS
ncbi:1-phosphatidylinositol 4,5-bisphosphate phosphodiesterase zeta-1-like isoform X2 [Gouania willdenowi]|uniref:Phosphoinositide phospholipase C n=1 Tax=Gouania willdenowi TaxID=441366 RepID=A0A8C5EQU4_GOUWI|nr:1-phosphatidylinositol 4,5-bisphosphate phosphodiesterase zeta-1-like isoform X2 [Gouania willdenowi]